jgi:hypothetical protein
MAVSEPQYEVVWPLGKSHWDTRELVSRLPDLSGKTIGEVWDRVFRGEEIFPVVRETMTRMFPGIRFVPYDTFGDTHGPKQKEVIAGLPEVLAAQGCDAVISGVGA